MPRSQSEQKLERALAEKVPPAQGVQSLAFEISEKVPALQSAQAASAVEAQAVARRVPGAQTAQVTQVLLPLR